MATNYAAMLLAWELLCEFAGLDVATANFKADAIAEVNAYLADTEHDREPFVWILEKLASEIRAKKFDRPHEWEEVLDIKTGRLELCLVVQASEVMDYMSSGIHLREWFNGLPVKTSRVFKQQCKDGDLVVKEDQTFTFGRARHFHALALSIEALEGKGIYMPVPEVRRNPERASGALPLEGEDAYYERER